LRVVRVNDGKALSRASQRLSGRRAGHAAARRHLEFCLELAVREDADVDTVVAKTLRERRLHRS
jgi:hypothetical protein